MALQLKVDIVSQNKTTAFRFNQEMTVQEALKQIKEKTGEGGADHGLFAPPDGRGSLGRWLRNDRTLMYFDLRSGDTVQFKKKHRPLKIKLLDETVKTVLIDDSLSVMEIVNAIGERIDLKNPEEYSLAKEGAQGWLHPTQSLQEQGVVESDMLCLKKKFFFSDANIDRSDPMQLHLLYIQSRDGIVSGMTPTSEMEAAQLAALQMQTEYSSYNASTHQKGFMKNLMPQFAPPGMRKNGAEFEKKVFSEYKKLTGMTEQNAKFRYVQLCRSLKTYGITCFNVQEKAPKGKKHLPIILGITRESILRMDTETKEIKQTWPLTHLRRWAASPKSFTLDFGDYEGEYYTVLTVEGEAISQLIAGYIDIILKKRKDTGRTEAEDDTIMAMEEDIAPIRAAVVQSTTTSIGVGAFGEDVAREMHLMPGMGLPGMMGMGGPNRMMPSGAQALANKSGIGGGANPINDLGGAEAAINDLLDDIENGTPWARAAQELTPEQWRSRAQENLIATGKTIEELMRMAQQGDLAGLDAASRSIFANINDMLNAARNAAAMNEDDISLLEGAKGVAQAVATILASAKDLAEHPDDPVLQARLASAARILQATQLFMGKRLEGKLITDPASEDLILASARAVTSAAAQLKLAADRAGQSVPSDTDRENLGRNAAGTEKAADYLDLTAKALAGVIAAPGASQMVADSGQSVQAMLGQLMKFANGKVQDPSHLDAMARAAANVNDAIAQLLSATECAGLKQDESIPSQVANIQGGIATLEEGRGQRAKLVAGCQAVSTAATAIVTSAKGTATLLDPEASERLLASAKVLAQHTASFANEGKATIQAPNDAAKHKAALDAAEGILADAKRLMDDAGKAVAFKSLQEAAKVATARTTKLVSSSRATAPKVSDPKVQADLDDAAKRAQESLMSLVDAIKNAHNNQQSVAAQNALLDVARNTAIPLSKLTQTSKASVPKVGDMIAKQELNQDTTSAHKALMDMVDAAKRVAEATGAREIEEALHATEASMIDLDALLLSVEAGMVQGTGGENLDKYLAELNQSVGALMEACNRLKETAQRDPDSFGIVVRDVGKAAAVVGQQTKTIANAAPDRTTQAAVLLAGRDVAKMTAAHIHTTRAKVITPAMEDRLLDSSQADVKDAVTSLVNAAKGADAAAKECDDAARQVQADLPNISVTAPAPPDMDFADAYESLEGAIQALSGQVTQVVIAGKTNPSALGQSAKGVVKEWKRFVGATNATVGLSPAPHKQPEAEAAQAVGQSAVRLLTAVKIARHDPAPTDRALADLSNNIAKLQNAVEAATPGAADLKAAYDTVKDAMAKHGGGERSADLSFNRRMLNDGVQGLGQNIGRVAATARNDAGQLGEHGKRLAADATLLLTAAHNINPGYIDMDDTCKTTSAAIAKIADPKTVVGASKDLAKCAAAIVAQAKAYSELSAAAGGSEDARKALLQAAQGVAQLTAQLGGVAKELVTNQPGAEQKARALQQEMNAKVAAVQATARKITASKDNTPNLALIEASRALADATCVMLSCMKAVAAKPKDAPTQSALSGAISGCTESIRKVMAASQTMVPGQKECNAAISSIQDDIGDLDSGVIGAAVGVYAHKAPENLTAQGAQEQVVDMTKALATATTKLVEAALKDAGRIGATVTDTASCIHAVAEATKDLAACTSDSATQQDRLNLSKNMTDSVLTLVKAVKAYAATPSSATQAALVEAAQRSRENISNMVSALRQDVLGMRLIDEALEEIGASLAITDRQLPVGGSYQAVRSKLQKESATLVQAITATLRSAQVGDADTVGKNAKKVAETLSQVLETTIAAAGATPDADAKPKLVQGGKGVCRGIHMVVSNAKSLTEDRQNDQHKRRLNESFKSVTEAIRNLTLAMKAAATGERDVELALDMIGKTNADIDSTALYAAMGQMEVDTDASKSLADYHADLSRAAKDLRQLGSEMVAASADSLEAVGKKGTAFAEVLEGLAQSSKQTASLLPDAGNQQTVLSGAKAVGITAQQLLIASRDVQLNPGDASAKQFLQSTTRNFAGALDLLDESATSATADLVRTIQAVDAAIGQIKRSVQTIPQSPGKQGATARDVIIGARAVAKATGDVSQGAASDQELLIKAASDMASGCGEMLNASKGACALADDPTVKQDLMNATCHAATAATKLLETAKTARADTAEGQQQMNQAQDKLADSIGEVVTALRKLPGGEDLELEENDLAAQAEAELTAAARQIEAAAARIQAAAAPREHFETEAERRQFEISESILDAARAIARAIHTLIQSATAAQKEIIAKGRANRAANPYKRDPAWANGLISAAKAVAGCTDDLVESANKAATKEAGEEVLIAATRGVAGATARLVAASKVKADPMSPSTQKLESAAKAVGAATQALVDAAKAAANVAAEEKQRELDAAASENAALGRRREFEQQVEVARLEKELEQARQRMLKARKQEYAGGGVSVSGASDAASPRMGATVAKMTAKPAPAAAKGKVAAGLPAPKGVAKASAKLSGIVGN